MTEEFCRVLQHVDDYLRTGEFWPLWRRIAGPEMEPARVDALPEAESSLYGELYEIVYMGVRGSATPLEQADGLQGGPELRAEVDRWRQNVPG